MDYKDYYKILGIPRTATPREIKQAFRALARQYHPDVNADPQAEARFKEVNEAYEVLSDPEKRRKYDQMGSSYSQWQGTGGQPGGFDWSPFMGGQPGGVRVEYGDASQVFSEFFNTFFGGAPARGASTGGSFSSLDDLLRSGGTSVRAGARDLETTVDITLDEAYHGTTRMVTIGSRRLQVKIPAGARTGTVVRLSGKGAASGGQPGDLYLNVVVQSDPRFEREGDDLHQEIVLDLYVAVLGGEVQVTTLSGTVTLKINPGTQPGQVIRLRGHGMPRIKHTDAHGDMYVRIGVELPESLSAKERALFRELASLRGYHPPE